MVQQDSPFTTSKPQKAHEDAATLALDYGSLGDFKGRYEELRELAKAEPYTGMGEVG